MQDLRFIKKLIAYNKILKTKIFIGFFIIYSGIIYAQPTWIGIDIDKNLNDFSYDEIKDCKKLNHGGLTCYCTFIIDSTTSLEKIKSLDSFSSLSLYINLPQIPKEFSNIKLDSLSTLGIRFGSQLQSLTEFLNFKLNRLSTLNINFDSHSQLQSLKGLQNLPVLKHLNINNFAGKYLPLELSNLSSLIDINISAPNIENIDVLTDIKNLKSIEIHSLKLHDIPQFKSNNKIVDLKLYVDSNFIDYTNISTLKQLKTLFIYGGNMKIFPANFGKKIQSLTISNLTYLTDISNIAQYKKLTHVIISSTGLKNSIADFSKLTHLTFFSISGNDSLKFIDGISSLKYLKEIEISNLSSLNEINFDMSKCRFKKMTLLDLNNLKNIEGITSCRTLKKLYLNHIGIENFPSNFYKLYNLKELHISHNEELIDISNIKNMKSLKRINFYECNKLKEIPFSFSSNFLLKSVHLEFMKQLTLIEGIVGLRKLKVLYIRAVNVNFSLPKNIDESTNIIKAR